MGCIDADVQSLIVFPWFEFHAALLRPAQQATYSSLLFFPNNLIDWLRALQGLSTNICCKI